MLLFFPVSAEQNYSVSASDSTNKLVSFHADLSSDFSDDYSYAEVSFII